MAKERGFEMTVLEMNSPLDKLWRSPYLGLKTGNPVCQVHAQLVAVQSKHVPPRRGPHMVIKR